MRRTSQQISNAILAANLAVMSPLSAVQAKDTANLTVSNFVDVGDSITDVVSTSGLAFSTMVMVSMVTGGARPRLASLHPSAPSSAAQTFETSCADGGSVKAMTRDADQSGDLSTRDRFVTIFDSCVMDGKVMTGRGEFVVVNHRLEGSTEITELEFRFKDLGTPELRWSGPARVSLRSDLRRGTDHYTVTYRDLAVTRGHHSMKWSFTLDLIRPPIGDQVASLHGAVTIGELHLLLRQEDPFVIPGAFPRSGQLTATDGLGARLQVEAGRWRYAYRLFRAGNRGVMPDSTSQSRPHGRH